MQDLHKNVTHSFSKHSGDLIITPAHTLLHGHCSALAPFPTSHTCSGTRCSMSSSAHPLLPCSAVDTVLWMLIRVIWPVWELRSCTQGPPADFPSILLGFDPALLFHLILTVYFTYIFNQGEHSTPGWMSEGWRRAPGCEREQRKHLGKERLHFVFKFDPLSAELILTRPRWEQFMHTKERPII